MKHEDGFTTVELVIATGLMALVVPLIFLAGLGIFKLTVWLLGA